MDKEQIAKEVIDCISESFDIEKAIITPDKHFIQDLEFDSLDAIELMMHIEGTFNIDIPDKDAEMIFTVQQAIDYVYNALHPRVE